MISVSFTERLKIALLKINYKEFLFFAPLFLIYTSFIYFFKNEGLSDDEPLYFSIANDITTGKYFIAEDVNLWVGPMYPIVIAVFTFLKFSITLIKLFNALFLYIAVLYFFKSLTFFSNKIKRNFLFSYIVGLYFPFFADLAKAMSEPFTYMLVSILIYKLLLVFEKNRIGYLSIFSTAIILTFLALTKAIFGYIILLMIIFYLFYYLIKKNTNKLIALKIYTLSLLLCLPYLGFTYTKTGNIFYWASSGGDLLYWKSTPYPGEYGDWHYFKFEGKQHNNETLISNHISFRDSIEKYEPIKRDELLYKKAIENIKEHPIKYIKNWISGIGSMIFASPFSYKLQKPAHLLISIPNAFVFVLSVLIFFPTLVLIRKKKFPFSLVFILTLFILYLILSSFLAVYWRHFSLMIFPLSLWIFYFFNKYIKFVEE